VETPVPHPTVALRLAVIILVVILTYLNLTLNPFPALVTVALDSAVSQHVNSTHALLERPRRWEPTRFNVHLKLLPLAQVLVVLVMSAQLLDAVNLFAQLPLALLLNA
jgi:hypothetical protein